MNQTFKKIVEILTTVLNWIGAIPVFFLPEKWKGYRTAIFNIGALVLAVLSAVLSETGMQDIPTMLTNLFMYFHITIPTWIIELIAGILWGAGNAKLRTQTDTSIFVAENAAGKKK